MDELGFGYCTNTAACEFECPKGIKIEHIAKLNREFIATKVGSQLPKEGGNFSI